MPRFITAFFLAAIVASGLTTRAQTEWGVPPERVARLARGVNISHWFWAGADREDAAARAAYFTDHDAQRLCEIGITCVRVPVDPDFLWDADKHALRTENLDEYKAAITMLNSRGLTVIVDPHPGDEPWIRMTPQPDAIKEYALFWHHLAGSLSRTDPGLVLFEIMNEPHGEEAARAWMEIQRVVAMHIRGHARHTIIATGAEWGSIDGLIALTPLGPNIGNVVYSFHFYEPHNFTHQGATWGFEPWRHMKGLPWPATAEELKAAAAKIENEKARGAVEWSAREQWNTEFIRGRIAKAAEWGKKHDVPVWCGEFGVYRRFAPAAGRATWIADVRQALEDHDIGWCMWDFSGGFALAPGEPGKRELDRATAAALGLKVPDEQEERVDP